MVATEKTMSVAAPAAGGVAAPGTAEWWHARHVQRVTRRPRRDGLTLARIIDAALGIVDAGGLDALIVRRLAEELGTGSASLYRHIGSREELLVLLVDHVLGDIRPPRSDLGWRKKVEWVARELRRVLTEHAHLAPLVTATQLLGPNALRGIELQLSSLLGAGFAPETAVEIHLAVVDYVVGSAVMNTSFGGRPAIRRKAAAALAADLPADTYPTVVRNAEYLVAYDGEHVFEVGLTALLDGLQGRRLAPT